MIRFTRSSRHGFLVAPLVAALGVISFVNAQAADTLKARFAQLFGAGTYAKIVWQVEGSTGRKPNFDQGSPSKIMALDTKDGAVRQLVPADAGTHYSSASLTWDGAKVVFTDNAKHKMMIVNWDGSNKKVLLSGWEGDGHCWRSPDNNNWALVTTATAPARFARVNIADTTQIINIIASITWASPGWAGYTCWASMSVDGRYCAGGWPNWPEMGMLNVQTGAILKPTQKDSWPTIARDNTYDMLFCNSSGSHKQFQIVDSTMAQKQLINLSASVLANDGAYEALRWSNDRAFVSMYIYKGGAAFSTVGISNPRIVRISDTTNLAWVAIEDNPQFPQGNADVFFYEGMTSIGSSHTIVPEATVINGNRAAGIFDSRGRAIADARMCRPGVYVSTPAGIPGRTVLSVKVVK